MKKEGLQNSQQGTGNTEDTDPNQQKNRTTNVSINQRNDFVRQAGLGRDRMTDIDDSEGLSGRDDYAVNKQDDLSNQDLNASNDQ